VGVPEPCEDTVAVNVRDCPKAEGFDVEVSEVGVELRPPACKKIEM
jgi:hypothetical protein